MRNALAISATALAVFLAGCGVQHADTPAVAVRPKDVLDFATLYSQNCAACHGKDGTTGSAMNLANPVYQALVDDASLRKWISAGMPGTQMTAFAQSNGGMLTDAQISAIIAGMRKEWSRPNVFAGAQPPSYAQEKAGDPHRGKQTFEQRCAICHKQERGQITDPVYLALTSDQALRTIIIAGRPDIGHPDWRHDAQDGKAAQPLSAQDVDDIVTYLASLRNPAPATAGIPSGTGSNPTTATQAGR
jgi:cytochrome c oxidase cbb3-type subunit III